MAEPVTKVINVDDVRADTAGCEHVIHFNNAGSALPPRPVADAVIEHLRLEERIGGYEAKAAQADRIEHTYDALARLIGATRDEIAVVENATRAWDMAFYSLRFEQGDRILTARAEYTSNIIAYLQTAHRHGAHVEVIPDDNHGQLSVDALRDMLDDRVKLIAISHIPTHNGLINPAAEIGEITREAGITYLLDACQSVGQIPINVNEIGCDLLSATGRKFLRGPRGTGFLYCSRTILDSLEPPFLDLHAAHLTGPHTYRIRDDARRFESWETYYAGKIGLGVAADYANALGLEAIQQRVTSLADALRQRLRAIPGTTVHDRGVHQSGIVTFTVAGWHSAEIATTLASQRINVSVAGTEHTRWNLDPRHTTPIVRASVHYYNTHDELDRACETLRQAR